MAAVWRAEDARSAPVALKLIPRGSAAAAAALPAVRHPNVARVLEVGEADSCDFLAMDWFDGRPLAEWLEGPRAARPRYKAVLAVLRQAAAGLLAAHRQGVVHGDFKPSNVLVDETGHAKVIDFGGGPDAAGHTHGYLAPERLFGAAPDAKSDQFGFCVTAYEALYRQRPFAGRHQRLLGRPRIPPRGRAPDPLFGPLQRGLRSTPEQRFEDMGALLDALGPPNRR